MIAIIETIIGDGLAFALPLFIMAVGGIFSERSGITNLALEGLMGFGAFFGAFFTTLIVTQNSALAENSIYIAMPLAMIGGALFAIIHAVLSIKFKANQVISGVVINILSVNLTAFLTRQLNGIVFGQTSDKFQLGVAPRYTIPVLSDIPVIGAMFRNVYAFQIVIIILAVLFYVILDKSRYGMRLKACGDNPQAVDAAGIDVEKVRFKAVLISGALSGIAGMAFCYMIMANFSPQIFMGYGYLSIAALIFGNWKILPTFAASIIFGFARTAGYELVKALGLSSNFSDVILILPYVLTLVLLIFFSKSNKAPRALGEIYDKGKR